MVRSEAQGQRRVSSSAGPSTDAHKPCCNYSVARRIATSLTRMHACMQPAGMQGSEPHSTHLFVWVSELEMFGLLQPVLYHSPRCVSVTGKVNLG